MRQAGSHERADGDNQTASQRTSGRGTKKIAAKRSVGRKEKRRERFEPDEVHRPTDRDDDR
jgi:hypothetical protein